MARMNPDLRRESIVAATLSVMQRHGIAATTVRDVAAELGTSSGLIHHYVTSMDELITEAFERAAGEDLERAAAAVGSGSEPIERLRRFFESYTRADDDSGMQLWLDAWAEAARRPALQRASRRLNEAWQGLVCTIITDGCSSGVMRCADPQAASWRLISLLDGLTLQTVAHGDTVSVEQAARWSRRAAEQELGLEPGILNGIEPGTLHSGRMH